MFVSFNNVRKIIVVLKKVTKISPNGEQEIIDSAIISEFSIILYINNKKTMELICTNSHIKELVIGRLLTEGIIDEIEDIEVISVSDDKGSVFVQLKKEFHNFMKEYRVLSPVSYENKWIFEMIQCFSQEGNLHKKTKAAHSCVLGCQGDVLFQCEDIGRHNAMDKAIGYMCIHKIQPEKCMLFTSGRVPTEMAGKAIVAGIPILISKAVPTDKALEMAKKYNLRLICKAWPDSFEIFN